MTNSPQVLTEALTLDHAARRPLAQLLKLHLLGVISGFRIVSWIYEDTAGVGEGTPSVADGHTWQKRGRCSIRQLGETLPKAILLPQNRHLLREAIVVFEMQAKKCDTAMDVAGSLCFRNKVTNVRKSDFAIA